MSTIDALPVGSAIFICYAIWYLVMMGRSASAPMYFWGQPPEWG